MELNTARNGVNGVADASVRISVLENRMDSLHNNVEKLEEKIDHNYATLHSRISDLRDDVTASIETKHEKLIEKLDYQARSSTDQHKAIADKVQQLEKWRWMLMGGAAVVGYFLAHLKFENLF